MLKAKTVTLNSYLETLLICLLSRFFLFFFFFLRLVGVLKYLHGRAREQRCVSAVYFSSVNLPSANPGFLLARRQFAAKAELNATRVLRDRGLVLGKPLPADKSGKLFCNPGEGTHYRQPFSSPS